MDTIITKLSQIAKDAVAEAHIVPTRSLYALICRIFELDIAPRGEVVHVLTACVDILSGTAQLHFSLHPIILNLITLCCRVAAPDELKGLSGHFELDLSIYIYLQ